MVMLDSTYEEIYKVFKNIDINPMNIVLDSKKHKDWHDKYFDIYDTYVEKKLNEQIENVNLIEYTIKSLDI